LAHSAVSKWMPYDTKYKTQEREREHTTLTFAYIAIPILVRSECAGIPISQRTTPWYSRCRWLHSTVRLTRYCFPTGKAPLPTGKVQRTHMQLTLSGTTESTLCPL